VTDKPPPMAKGTRKMKRAGIRVHVSLTAENYSYFERKCRLQMESYSLVLNRLLDRIRCQNSEEST
jgi:hypothetical protein